MLNTDIRLIDFTTRTAVELRSLASKLGIKGASKGRKDDLIAALNVIQDEQRAERARQDAEAAAAAKAAEVEAAELAAEAEAAQEALAEAEAAPVATKAPKNLCPICGLRKKYSGNANGEKAPRLSDMCNPCYAEGGWENSHGDSNHDAILETPEADRTPDQLAEIDGCWICYPELNLAKAEPKAGRSRAGMVIVAKGTEIHKSETFRKAAEAAGWSVTMDRETYEMGDDAEGEGTRYYATATRGESHIALAWDGRAYDYHASGASFNGKGRKVRNLKEALRLL